MNEGELVSGRFRIERLLGRGAMGEVWRAFDVRLDTPCALKFMRSQFVTPEQRERLEREAKAAARLRSQHIVQVLDHGDHEGVPYIAMELLRGEDLASRLARAGRLSARQTVRVVGSIAKALARAHAAGLVHRDLKPANVFLVDDVEGEVVKVVDFGIVKIAGGDAPASVRAAGGASDASVTQTGAFLGTPLYMSPEQTLGSSDVDARSDLWSLGVLAFECLTGRPPFESENLADLVMMIQRQPIPRVTALVPELPPGLDAWAERALARDPNARFQTAGELADALTAAVGDAIDLPGPGLAQPRPDVGAHSPAAFDDTQIAPPSAARTAPSFGGATGPTAARPRAWMPWAFGGGAVLVGLAVLGGWAAFRHPAPSTSASAAPDPLSLPVVAPFPASSESPYGPRRIPEYEGSRLRARVEALGFSVGSVNDGDQGGHVTHMVVVTNDLCSGAVAYDEYPDEATAQRNYDGTAKIFENQYPITRDGRRVLYVSLMGHGREASRACAAKLFEGLTDP